MQPHVYVHVHVVHVYIICVWCKAVSPWYCVPISLYWFIFERNWGGASGSLMCTVLAMQESAHLYVYAMSHTQNHIQRRSTSSKLTIK